MNNEPRLLPNGHYAYPFYVFYKFQTKSILKDLQGRGHIYMKNLDYFIKLEQTTGDDNIGDAKEALSFRSSLKLEYNGNQIIDLGTCDVRLGSEIKKPVYCLTCIDILDYITETTQTTIECVPAFDNNIIDGFKKEDEELYVLIIDAVSFQNKIKQYLDENYIKYKCNFVEYRDTNIFYRKDEHISFNGPFHKRQKFAYQKEFRYIIDKQIEDEECFEICIGDISDISHLCKAEELLQNKYKYILELNN
jgi:hypothetical protein